MDIVVVNALGVLAYLNLGQGRWSAVVVIDDEQTPFPWAGESHYRLALGDWDGDGTCPPLLALSPTMSLGVHA